MNLKELYLPIRFERLRQKAEQAQADLGRIIMPVQAGIDHVQGIFQEITQTGVSRFEVFYGASGVGKTTFFETLDRFFQNVGVLGIDKDKSFEETIAIIRQSDVKSKFANNVVYLKDRDTPTEGDDVLLKFSTTCGFSFEVVNAATWSHGQSRSLKRQLDSSSLQRKSVRTV